MSAASVPPFVLVTGRVIAPSTKHRYTTMSRQRLGPRRNEKNAFHVISELVRGLGPGPEGSK
jgi:hypothetical protein